MYCVLFCGLWTVHPMNTRHKDVQLSVSSNNHHNYIHDLFFSSETLSRPKFCSKPGVGIWMCRMEFKTLHRQCGHSAKKLPSELRLNLLWVLRWWGFPNLCASVLYRVKEPTSLLKLSRQQFQSWVSYLGNSHLFILLELIRFRKIGVGFLSLLQISEIIQLPRGFAAVVTALETFAYAHSLALWAYSSLSSGTWWNRIVHLPSGGETDRRTHWVPPPSLSSKNSVDLTCFYTCPIAKDSMTSQ